MGSGRNWYVTLKGPDNHLAETTCMISLTIFSEKVRTWGSYRGRNKASGRLATFVSQEKIWKIWHHSCKQESKAQLFSGAKLEILFNCCLRNMYPSGNARTLVLIIAHRTDVISLFLMFSGEERPSGVISLQNVIWQVCWFDPLKIRHKMPVTATNCLHF